VSWVRNVQFVNIVCIKQEPFVVVLKMVFVKSTRAQIVDTGRFRMVKKQKRDSLYSKGQKNFLIDAAVHPLAKITPIAFFFDEALHMLNEQDLRIRAEKFCRYTLPEIIKATSKRRRLQ
jgi:hypothetical protein